MEQHLEALSPETVAGFFLVEALAVTKRFLRVEVQDSGVGQVRSLEKNPQVSQSTIFIYYDDNFFFCALLFELLFYYTSHSLHHIIILYLKIYQ